MGHEMVGDGGEGSADGQQEVRAHVHQDEEQIWLEEPKLNKREEGREGGIEVLCLTWDGQWQRSKRGGGWMKNGLWRQVETAVGKCYLEMVN